MNILRAQFGYVKDDCLTALKIKKNDPQCWILLIKSRLFVEKLDEASKYIRDASLSCPDEPKLVAMRAKCDELQGQEIEKVKKIEIINEARQDKMMAVYRAIRSRGIKLGKRVHELPEVHDQHIKLDNR